ncbi:MAG TPA: acetyl-CoA hydrolase/transferase C-terminal domain-containing protein [Anaerolineae bacterium]|nr:acetyl-CoA hydrolase/transferase family protein [Anaerolineae bacterium]MCB0222681.1 acetyl-CoA hydrolase/transferase family protein [Anaerolineae bacterium]MCB9107726.1 acetyl-CoA hydrolase/transferase family protein [Anaerolineales bacterium]HRV90606.1 acetyl-CoA hydrolase/transferase C-terminal domain-containing protein [Anaerolineae bacterium]
MMLDTNYRRKITDGDLALASIKSGQRIYLGGGAGVPLTLIEGLMRRAHMLRNVEITHILTFADAPYVDPEVAASFRHNALFIGSAVRRSVQEGRADFTPVFLSEIPGLLRNGVLHIDVALISVSPPDEHGFCSFGVEVGTTKPAAEAAKVVIAEINHQMPRTMGDSFIHVSRLTHIIETDYPLPEAPQGGASEEHMMIGQYIAEMIPDGATLQMGIGSIPDAVLQNLGNHKDLGVHTELFSDGVIDMVEAGVITCSQKTFHPGKIVAGFLFGSKRLYDFVNNNPIIELHPTDYVNDPFNVAKNDKMVSINSAIQVDLTGQVCADSIGTRFYSGVGGQVDFVRGAARSKGGLPIIAFPSTTRNESTSRIVPILSEGAGVTTTRNDVHYIVTEYGVASLHGKTIHQRVQELINIAHPKFRDELTRAAHDLGYV